MNAKQEILDVFNLYLGFADPEDLSIIADKLIERLHTTLPQSQKNLDLIDNFLLFVTHMSRCDLPEEGPDYPNHLFSANDLYQAALDYIEEDHVDGKEADEYLISQETKYPRGIESWIKTFYDMAILMNNVFQYAFDMAEAHQEITDGQFDLVECHNLHGAIGIQELTEEWTTEFETIHKDTDWHDGDHDFWIIIDEFVNNKLK